jgi:hypothetical protein
VGAFARLRDWLYQPAAGAKPPGPDQLVEVTRFATRQDAELALFELRANGIQAMVQHNDGNGMVPHFGIADGHRVLVFGRDLDVAAAVLTGGSES